MTARFLHTADWQLGKPFAGVADAEKRALLRQERIEVLKRTGAAAQEHAAEFIVVAGDAFDSPAATRDTVAAACAAIGAMQRPVFLIPGNHDHGGPGSLWEQPFFLRQKEELAPNLHILLTPEPVETDTALLLPCPLLRRHENTDTTAWLRAFETDSEKPRIVLAHGSVQGFGGDDDDEESGGGMNQIDLTRLEDGRFDYIALGDWHGTKQVGPRAWYAGTPEPDRFPRNDPGHVLLVAAARGALPEVTAVRTARIGWHELAFRFHDDTALTELSEQLKSLTGGRAQQDLLRLELTGALGITTAAELEKLLESWQARLLRLKLDNQTRLAPAAEELNALTHRAEDPLIARVAAQLAERQKGDTEDAAVARTALRLLHSRLTA